MKLLDWPHEEATVDLLQVNDLNKGGRIGFPNDGNGVFNFKGGDDHLEDAARLAGIDAAAL